MKKVHRSYRPLERERAVAALRSIRAWVWTACVALSSCVSISDKAVEWTYDRSPWLLKQRIGQYVDLTPTQEDSLEPVLDRVHAWHRAQELPSYSRMLERAADRVEAGLTETDVHGFLREARQHLATTSARLVSALDPVTRTLTPDQAGQISARFAKENERFRRDLLRQDAGAAQRERTERVKDHLERWTGPLNDTQEALIADLNRRTAGFPSVRLAERKTLQRAFVDTVSRGSDGPSRSAALLALLSAPATSPDASYRSALSAYDREFARTLVQLSSTLTPRQRQTAVERLRRVGRHLGTLSGRTTAVQEQARPAVSPAGTDAAGPRAADRRRLRAPDPDRRSAEAAVRVP